MSLDNVMPKKEEEKGGIFANKMLKKLIVDLRLLIIIWIKLNVLGSLRQCIYGR
jgi:hypothetical protein